MGVDVMLAARTRKLRSEEELRELNYRFMEACTVGYSKNPIQLQTFEDSKLYFYNVYSLDRLYSESYARGNWPQIYASIEWLRYNFPEADIIYGGDHSFIEELPVLSKDEQENIMKFWCATGGLTYRHKELTDPLFKRKCPNCLVVMSQYMWSGGNGEIACLGCNYREKTEDKGETWVEIKKVV